MTKKSQVPKKSTAAFFANASVEEIRNHIIKFALTKDGEEVKTTSLDVAEITGKRHADILRKIDQINLELTSCSQRKIALAKYKDAQGKPRTMAEMDFDEFNLLMGRMSGKIAIRYQLAFQAAFEMVINANQKLIKENLELRLSKMEDDLSLAVSDKQIYSAQNQKLWVWFKRAHENFLKVAPKRPWGEISKTTGLPKKQIVGAYPKTARKPQFEHPEHYLNTDYMIQAQRQLETQNQMIQDDLL